MSVDNHQVEMLERRCWGEHPFHTLLYLFQGDYWNLLKAMFYYILKHSGVWAMGSLSKSANTMNSSKMVESMPICTACPC